MPLGKSTQVQAGEDGSFLKLLRGRNFRLLWAAGTLSAIGDQFDLIAFPWLVLLISGDPLAVGTIIATSSIPTVFFMLIGGSLVDRFSPHLIMQTNNVVRIVLTAALAILVLTELTNLWVLYLFALLKGIADAFYYPAQAALLPRIVTRGQLRQSNAVVQTTVELSGFVGPMLAGALIALFSGTHGITLAPDNAASAEPSSTTGVGLAFAVVAVAFFFSALLLAWMRLERREQAAADRRPAEQDSRAGIWASIAQGLRFVRADAAMFTLFILIAGIELFVQGPAIVGIPILANTQLLEGVLALGIISAAYAGGSLLGAVLAGALPAPQRRLGPLFMVLFALSGLLLTPFGFLTITWIAAGLVLVIGIMGGYANILFTAWLQGRTPQAMMGRVMSLLMVASIGLSPVSNAVSGALIKLSLGWVFVGAGAAMALLCLLVGFRREIRTL